VIRFYDLRDGRIYEPFGKKRNTAYGKPIYANGRFWFLQADLTERKVTLFRYMPVHDPESVAEFVMDEVRLYNLQLIGNPLYMISQDGKTAECYYPERFSIPLCARQTVELIEDGKVYLEEWEEEGWDELSGRATDDYRYYSKIIATDLSSNVLSEETGSLFRAPDGTYWIA